MRLRLPGKIGVTAATNLLLLAILIGVVLTVQGRSDIESLLLAPAQERVRALGSQVALELGAAPAAGRDAILARYAKRNGLSIVLYDRDGNRVAGPNLYPPEQVLGEIRRQPARRWEFEEPRDPGSEHPVFLVHEKKPSRYWIGVHIPLETGQPPERIRHALVIVTSSLLGNRFFFDWMPWALGAMAALLGSVLCWAPLVRGIMRSIETMRQAAASIARGHFEVQVPIRRNDELGELGASIESMAQQLARHANGQRRFLADVAHELCAPLSRIQLSAGILEEKVTGSDLEYVRRLERDLGHMSNLVSDLLSFSKGTARPPELVPLPLAPLVEEVVNRERNGKGEIALRIEPGSVVLADAEYLRRAVGNLVRNAIAYAGNAGPIRIESKQRPGWVRLLVLDEGPGLPNAELDAVFEPFYRPDVSRDRETGGVGLGLAIVKSCVEACGGSVHCRNRKPTGLEVVLELRAG
jgi:two-component system sensor histidine kinase CpxA